MRPTMRAEDPHFCRDAVQVDLDAVARQSVRHHLRRVALFQRQEQRFAVRDERSRTEAGEHLRQLAPQRSAANHQQALGQHLQVEHRFIGQETRLGKPRNVGQHRTRARGNHGLLESQRRAVDIHRVGPREACRAEEQMDACAREVHRRIVAVQASKLAVVSGWVFEPRPSAYSTRASS